MSTLSAHSYSSSSSNPGSLIALNFWASNGIRTRNPSATTVMEMSNKIGFVNASQYQWRILANTSGQLMGRISLRRESSKGVSSVEPASGGGGWGGRVRPTPSAGDSRAVSAKGHPASTANNNRTTRTMGRTIAPFLKRDLIV